MNLLLMKCAYFSLLKNCRLKLRFKCYSSSSLNLTDVIENMPRKKKSCLSPQADLTHIGLEVLGNSSRLSPCAVSLNTSSRCYLFNCGEGLQKMWSEYKIRPSRYSDIFITYPTWKNIGGLLGATLSMQESKVKSFTVHGHPCLERLFSLSRNIVNFKAINSTVNFCGNNSTFKDEFINVKFIHLNKSPSPPIDKCMAASAHHKHDEVGSSSVQDKTETSNEELSHGAFKISGESSNSEQSQKHLDDDGNFGNKKEFALSFIIHTEKSKGSLSFEKCMDLGVPVGPLLGRLKQGEDVTLENGRIIKSSEVKFPDLPGAIIIVVECPSEDYLDALLNEPAFFKHQTEKIDHYSCAVVHFSSLKIIKNEKYQQWINCFDKGTKHVFVNESSEIGAFIGLHRHQFKLNMVHKEIFPLLHSLGIPDYPRSENCITDAGHKEIILRSSQYDKNSPLQIYSDKTYYMCKNNNKINAEALCEINLKPKRQYDYTKCLTLKKNEFLKEILQVPNIKEDLEKFTQKIKNVEKSLQSEKKIYPKIVFLGTGSKKPSKTRNSSGILVFLDENKSIILDCGESTYNQLLLCFGKEKTAEILRNLSAVFVSHMHIDHHLGLATLLLERKIAFDALLTSESTSDGSFSPLRVIAPVQLLPLLQYLSTEILDTHNLYKVIPCTAILEYPVKDEIQKEIDALNLDLFQTTRVNHAPHSFGVTMKHKDNWKITYSGDTQPCQNLVKIGKDSDVLIHEATFDDIYEIEAAEKLHSTTKQAVDVGREMNAKFILLTHFSQRYAHLPMIKEELLSENNVGVAFDFMQISFYQLPILSYLHEPIKLIFSSYFEKLEHHDMLLRLKKEGMDRKRGKSFFEQKGIPYKIPKISNA